MSRKQFVLVIVAMGMAVSVALADGPADAPVFQQWVRDRTRFGFVNGRVVNLAPNMVFGVPRQIYANGPVREKINFNGNGVSGSMAYSYERRNEKAGKPDELEVEFAFEVSSEGRFLLSYSEKSHPEKFFRLLQSPAQAVVLSLPPTSKPRELKAPTIWHMLVIHPEECRTQMLPTMEMIHPDWHVARTAQGAEDELLKMAASSRKADRKQWDAWVAQLGNERWSRREAADRSLRDVGPAVVGYLSHLDTARLDAEQQFRVRRIIRSLSTQAGEDTPERVASMLIDDPAIWLAMLSRPEESTRQAAVQQLAFLLNKPINIDPKAEPATQEKAREALRAEIEK